MRGNDWQASILRAWSDALQRTPEALWVEEFLSQGKSLDLPLNTVDLLALLPVRERERHWLSMLDHETKIGTRVQVLIDVLEAFAECQESPSEAFSHRILAEIHQLVDRPASGGLYEISRALPGFVCLVPPACLAAARDGWKVGHPDDYFTRTLAGILAIVEQRKILHQFF